MAVENEKESRMPYQLSFPKEALDEIVVPHAIPEDERVWVPLSGYDRCA